MVRESCATWLRPSPGQSGGNNTSTDGERQPTTEWHCTGSERLPIFRVPTTISGSFIFKAKACARIMEKHFSGSKGRRIERRSRASQPWLFI